MKSDRKTVAIIGGGAAGLGAAWLLDRELDVTVYEAGQALGGNALTVDFPTSSGSIPVDLGVIVLQPFTYPNLFTLFDLLGVSTTAAGLTFGASFGPDDSWITGKLEATALGRRLAGECSRFELDMYRAANLSEQAGYERAGDHLRQRGYSEEFLAKALAPAMGSLVVTGGGLLDSPISFVSIVFRYYFSFFAPVTWRVIPRGTREYVEKLAARLEGQVRLSTPVSRVTRLPDGVVVRDACGGEAKFDEVIFATGADTARALLGDPSPLEAELLGRFSYRPVTVYLHTDEGLLSPYFPEETRSEYTYYGPDVGPDLKGKLTFRSQLYQSSRAPLVTYDWGDGPPPEGVVAEVKDWKHYAMTPRSLEASRRLHEIQGVNRTWFAGQYFTYAYHEGAFVSGMAVAEALGAVYPFTDVPLAAQVFAGVRELMFPRSR